MLHPSLTDLLKRSSTQEGELSADLEYSLPSLEWILEKLLPICVNKEAHLQE